MMILHYNDTTLNEVTIIQSKPSIQSTAIYLFQTNRSIQKFMIIIFIVKCELPFCTSDNHVATSYIPLQVPLTDPFFKEMFQTRVNSYPYIQRLHSTAVTEEDNCTMLEIQVLNSVCRFLSTRIKQQKNRGPIKIGQKIVLSSIFSYIFQYF